jgi:hypothetical protein
VSDGRERRAVSGSDPAPATPISPPPEGASTDGGRLSTPLTRSWTRAAAIGATFAVVLLALSTVTVLRLSATNIAADAVLQSVMSVQDVDWFFWGQDRFASVVPLLAGPIADPNANLVACQLINALSFYGLLLLVASTGARSLTGSRTWLAVLVVFLVSAATAQLVLEPLSLYFMALDAQPYSLSWLLGLGSFLLWRRPNWWWVAPAAALSWIAIGLNPSVVLGVAALAILEMIRRRQWIRWPVFGAVWLAGLGSWLTISSRFAADPGPVVYGAPDYYTFHPDLFGANAGQSAGAIAGGFSTVPAVVLAVIAVVSFLVIPSRVRTALLVRFALLTVFAAGYWTVFTGNSWVAANGSAIRYFFPVVLIILLGLSAPMAGALLAARVPSTVPIAIAATVCAGASLGAQVPISDSPVLQQVDATVQYARSNGVSFVAGSYWYAWPVLHQMLVDGRDAAFATALRSGGDPVAYRRKLDAELIAGSRPRAICVDDTVESCVSYLSYWTAPGWSAVADLTCPAPERPAGDDSAEPTCRILEFTGASAP